MNFYLNRFQSNCWKVSKEHGPKSNDYTKLLLNNIMYCSTSHEDQHCTYNFGCDCFHGRIHYSTCHILIRVIEISNSANAAPYHCHIHICTYTYILIIATYMVTIMYMYIHTFIHTHTHTHEWLWLGCKIIYHKSSRQNPEEHQKYDGAWER